MHETKKNKTIFILIGAKGSGKTFIGTLIQNNFHIPFLRVEQWVKKVKHDREITSKLYHIEAFAAIENGVRNFLVENDKVVFETTGLTHQFEIMLESLKEDFRVVTICIKTDPDLCLERFKNRDQSVHVNISDEDVKMINEAFEKNNFKTDFILNNNNKSESWLLERIKKILVMAEKEK